MPIHPTAIVDAAADIDDTADIGAYAIVEGPVRVGPGTRVYPHAYLAGWTEIGADCRIHPGAVVGHLPQDFAYTGAETYCRIGDGTIIRENCSVHRGTEPGTTTTIGRHCYMMATTHVAHNCTLADHVTIANGAMLAGHVQVGPSAFISGGVGIHQFVRIGELAMLAGQTVLTMDVPPFLLTDRNGRCAGVNRVGIRRAEFTPEEQLDIKQIYRATYRSGKPFRQSVDRAAEHVTTDPGRRLIDFLRAPSKRGIVGPSNSSVDRSS